MPVTASFTQLLLLVALGTNDCWFTWSCFQIGLLWGRLWSVVPAFFSINQRLLLCMAIGWRGCELLTEQPYISSYPLRVLQLNLLQVKWKLDSYQEVSKQCTNSWESYAQLNGTQNSVKFQSYTTIEAQHLSGFSLGIWSITLNQLVQFSSLLLCNLLFLQCHEYEIESDVL
jgi:hypothetical protein